MKPILKVIEELQVTMDRDDIEIKASESEDCIVFSFKPDTGLDYLDFNCFPYNEKGVEIAYIFAEILDEYDVNY
jgi:hypothetical protein